MNTQALMSDTYLRSLRTPFKPMWFNIYAGEPVVYGTMWFARESADNTPATRKPIYRIKVTLK